MIDYDDPQEEERWCDESRQRVIEYLENEGVAHGQVGEWPAWHLAPFISIWAIESVKSPGWVGWWVITGDVPSDYISAEIVKHPRDAMRIFAEKWQEVAKYMREGKAHPTYEIGSPKIWPTLEPLLDARADILLKFANDERIWVEEDN